jgi:hypothetical protein
VGTAKQQSDDGNSKVPPRTYKKSQLHALLARSGNRCAVCKQRLSVDTASGKALMIGEVAHIVGHSPAGPRGCAALLGQVDNYDNLVLLCPTCHATVDKNEADWSADELRKRKQDHERWVEQQPTALRAELEGVTILAEGIDSEVVEGLVVESATRIGPGTSVTARAQNAERIVGVRIGRQDGG